MTNATIGTCENCNGTHPLREQDGSLFCQRCYVGGLRHGHLHGLHTDHAWDADSREAFADCPDCATACRDYDARIAAK